MISPISRAVLSTILVLSGFCSVSIGQIKQSYTFDLTHTDEDRFHVNLDVSGLTEDSVIFQFGVTAPGVYEVLDPGRFVTDFAALDNHRKRLLWRRGDVNQFIIYDARRLRSVSYKVDDTFDTTLAVHPINPMCGSNLEETNAVINNQMVAGFFHGHQAAPIDVSIIAPPHWKIGTALRRGRGGVFKADSFDHLVDSPFLAGDLTAVNMKLDQTFVDVFVFSESLTFDAAMLQIPVQKILSAARDFLGTLPVDRYTFLFHYRQDTGPIFGAWEHNLSSLYVLPEWNPEYMLTVTSSMAAHEFFHIISPLHIHSDLIQPFDFVSPKASRHLWFYEGVTEWASDMMQVKDGLITDSVFIERVRTKIKNAQHYRSDISLVELSLGSYGEYNDQFGNIYEKGALVALLLDMELLKLSNGTIGLRDVVMKLMRRFGKDRPFTDSTFFEIFIEESHPDIAPFLQKYISGKEPLPFARCLGYAGYDYAEELETGLTESSGGFFDVDYVDDKIVVAGVEPADTVAQRLGILPGDTLLEMKFGESTFSASEPGLFDVITLLPGGFPFSWKINRNGRRLTLHAFTGQRRVIEKHAIRPVANPTESQERFRRKWQHAP